MADAAVRFGPDAPDAYQVAQAGSGEAVGHVETVHGDAFVTHVDGTRVAAHTGTPIFQGDTVDTGAHGAVGIVFVDKSTFALSESGHMTIDQMVYDPSTQHGSSLVGITQGVFTFVSGEIAKTQVDAMKIHTAVATLGIRGTSGGGRIEPGQGGGPPQATFSLFHDPGGGSGEMTVFTTGGSVVLNQPNATTLLSSPFLPPTPPVVLPAQAVLRAYASAAQTMPSAPQTQHQNNSGNGGGQGQGQGTDHGAGQGAHGGQSSQGGNGNGAGNAAAHQNAAAGGTADAAAAAADQAAAQAFSQALASGASLGDALTAAVQTASETEVRFGVDPTQVNQLTAQDVTTSALDTVVQQSLGALGAVAVPTAVTHNLVPSGGGTSGGATATGGDQGTGTTGDGTVPVGGVDLQAFTPPPPPPPTTTVVDTTQPPLQTTNADQGTTSIFPQTITGTTGNDTLNGNDANTQFIMTQGSSLGGHDVLYGNGGTDEVAFSHLSDMQMIWNISADTITYSNGAGTVTGTVALNSVEQIYADNGQEASTRLQLDLTTGYAYILAGTTGADTLDASASHSLAYLSGVAGYQLSDATTAGVLIFAGAGNDTITGSAVGDIIFPGSGNDIVAAGTGDDNIVISPANLDANDNINGGGGTDQLIFVGGGTVVDSAFTNVVSIEQITLDAHAYNLTLGTSANGMSGGNLYVDGTTLGTHALTLDATAFTGNLTVDLTGAAAAHDIVGGSGYNFFTISAGDLANDTLNGGSGNSIVDLVGGGSLADSAFTHISNIATVSLDAHDYSITLGSIAAGQFLAGLNIDGSSLGAHALTLDASGFGAGGIAVTVDLTGSSGDNHITGSLGADSIIGGSGNDTFTGTGGHDTVDISNGGADTVHAGSGGVDVTAGAAFDSGDVITGSDGGTDTLSLNGDYSGGISLGNVTNLDGLILSDGHSYNLTLGSATADPTNGLAVDGSLLTGSNALTLNGSAVATALSIIGGAGADHLVGGAGDDAIQGGDGADTLTGGNGANTFIYSAASQGGDTITDFKAGASGDTIQYDLGFTIDSSSTFESGPLSTLNTVSNDAVHVVTDTISGYSNASSVAAAVTGLTGAIMGVKAVLVTSDGTNSQVWSWNDSAGNGDGKVDSSELTAVAHLDHVDAAALDTHNFVGTG